MIVKNDYIKIAIKASKEGLKILDRNYNKRIKYKFDKKIQKEIKTKIDLIIEKNIIKILSKTKIPILSEESDNINYLKKNKLLWIVDPLDGTYNYIRKINSCAISIALFENNEPLFGVIAEFPSKKIAWGGRKIGSYINNKKIKVSSLSLLKQSVLCTGFPVRFKFSNYNIANFLKKFKKYGKIRMIGSAAISLLYLAQGYVESYEEQNIMIWDVAAGLAIVEGAGGIATINQGDFINSISVKANNAKIK